LIRNLNYEIQEKVLAFIKAKGRKVISTLYSRAFNTLIFILTENMKKHALAAAMLLD